ncbi:MAG: flagellar assembly protein A, partial [Deltaproteobacteria bacterium]
MERQNKTTTGKDIKIKVSADKMEAFLVTPAGTMLEPQEVFQALQEAGIVYGIDIDGIHRLCEELFVAGHFLVAMGLPSVPGEKAQVTYFYDKPELKPETTEDGRVDFYNLGGIIQVKAGDILAERKPATEGTPGNNVLGEVLNPMPGKQVPFQIAKGAKAIGDQVIAEFDGAVTWQGP